MKDQERKAVLDRARERLEQVNLPKEVLQRCVDVATAFKSEGHRGEQVMALAARAHAALRIATAESLPFQGLNPAVASEATLDDVTRVARLAIQHRRPQSLRSDQVTWSAEDDQQVLKPVP